MSSNREVPATLDLEDSHGAARIHQLRLRQRRPAQGPARRAVEEPRLALRDRRLVDQGTFGGLEGEGASEDTRQRPRDRAVWQEHAHGYGVAIELSIAQEEGIPYFLLAGYNEGATMPTTAKPDDKLYKWTWENLKLLVGGAR